MNIHDVYARSTFKPRSYSRLEHLAYTFFRSWGLNAPQLWRNAGNLSRCTCCSP